MESQSAKMIDAISCWCTGPVPWLMDKHLQRGAREGRKRSYHVRLGANRKLRTRHKSYSLGAQLGDKEEVQISLLVGITRQSLFFSSSRTTRSGPAPFALFSI